MNAAVVYHNGGIAQRHLSRTNDQQMREIAFSMPYSKAFLCNNSTYIHAQCINAVNKHGLIIIRVTALPFIPNRCGGTAKDAGITGICSRARNENSNTCTDSQASVLEETAGAATAFLVSCGSF